MATLNVSDKKRRPLPDLIDTLSGHLYTHTEILALAAVICKRRLNSERPATPEQTRAMHRVIDGVLTVLEGDPKLPELLEYLGAS